MVYSLLVDSVSTTFLYFLRLFGLVSPWSLSFNLRLAVVFALNQDIQVGNSTQPALSKVEVPGENANLGSCGCVESKVSKQPSGVPAWDDSLNQDTGL